MHKKIAIGFVCIIVVSLMGYVIWSNGKKTQLIKSAHSFSETATPNTTAPESVLATTVLWHAPTEIATPDIFDLSNSFTKAAIENMKAGSHFFSIGTFADGKYKGGTLVNAQIKCDGSCDYFYVKLALQNGTYSMLLNGAKRSDFTPENFGFDPQRVALDTSTIIPALVLPGDLFDLTRNTHFTLVSNDYDLLKPFDPTGMELAFTDVTYGPVYVALDASQENFPPARLRSGLQGSFYVPLPDGNVSVYQEVFPFIANGTVPGSVQNTEGFVWNDTQVNNTASYESSTEGVCSSSALADVLSAKDLASLKLKPIAVTQSGETVYALSDSHDPMLQAYYGEVTGNGNAYAGKKMSYAAFLLTHPLFFYKDPYGRMIRFHNTQIFQPAGGC